MSDRAMDDRHVHVRQVKDPYVNSRGGNDNARTLGARSIAAAVALGAGAAGAALWVLQHRRVSRAVAAGAELEAEGLTPPEDLRHRMVTTDDGARIHVAERGEGPPLVLLHGFVLDGSIWSQQFRDLAASRRVVAVDHRGHGRSVPGSSGFDAPTEPGASMAGRDGEEFDAAAPPEVAREGEGLADAARSAHPVRAGGNRALGRLAADLACVLEELDLERALVVGHSMGGMVALALAREHPATFARRVGGLVLVSTMAGPFVGLPGWSDVARAAAPVSARALLYAQRLGVRALPSRDLRWWLSRVGFGADATPAQVRLVEELHRATPARTLAGLLPSLATSDLSAGLGSVEVPTLVVVGSRDRLTTPRQARRSTNALPRAELVELPRCGHMPMIERPHEFSHLLEEFSAKVAGG